MGKFRRKGPAGERCADWSSAARHEPGLPLVSRRHCAGWFAAGPSHPSSAELFRSSGAARVAEVDLPMVTPAPACSRSVARRDVLVHPEQIPWIPLRLDLDEPLVGGAVRGLDALARFLFCEEVHVGPAGREAPHVL